MLLARVRRRLRSEDLPAWLFTLWALTLVVRGHLPYLRNPYEVNVDEGYLLAVAQRMLHGQLLPFVDGAAHTGPLFLWSGALIAAFGEFSWLPVRIAAALGFVVLSLSLFLVARAAGHRLAGALAAAGVPLVSVLRFVSNDGLAYNAELPANLCALGALWLALRAVPREGPLRGRAALGAGVLVCGAVLSKQVGALIALPVALYVLVALVARRDVALRARLGLLVRFGAASLAPAALVVLWYALAGELHDLWYYLVVYNRDIYMHYWQDESRLALYRVWFGERPVELALLVAAVASGASQLVRARRETASWAQAYQHAGFVLTVALMSVAGIVGARASLRDFDHYYLLAVPWLALLGGLVLEQAALGGAALARPRTYAVAQSALLLVPVALGMEIAWSVKQERLVSWSGQHQQMVDPVAASHEPPVCALVRQHTKPDERLFVWGFRPELYVSCARLPASRFVFTTFVSGVVPWHGASTKEQEDALAVPGSRAQLIAELEAEKPPIVIDIPRTLAGRSMRRYEQLARYLDAHYRSIAVIEGDEVLLRKGP